MRRISLALIFVCALFSLFPAGPAVGSPRTSLANCVIQELRTPLPKSVVENSLPMRFEPASFEGLPDSPMGAGVSTSFQCIRGGREITETWIWVPVVPPKHLRTRGADEYGFLLKGYNGSGRIAAGAERRCLSNIFEAASVAMTLDQADTGDKITTVAQGAEGSDEVHSVAGAEAEAISRRTRLFGYTRTGTVRSFDVTMSSEETASGAGMEFQNSGRLDAEDGQIGLPGTFAGPATHLHAATIAFDRSARSGC